MNGNDVMHPAHLDVVGVEPPPRQRRQEAVLGREPFDRRHTGRRDAHRMHPLVEPEPGPPVQLVEIGGDAVEFDLGQERLLQLTERSLDLAFAFRVTGLTGLDLVP